MSSIQPADGSLPSAGVDRGGLADLIRQHTADLHTAAERTGVIRGILRGQVERAAYILLLRNLLPAYEMLEAGLERHRASSLLGSLARGEVYRAAGLAEDLRALAGADWHEAVPLLQSGRDYASRVADAAEGDGRLLVAHAYVRYLGDLNGGQVLKRLVARALGVGGEALTFYEFPQIDDLVAFRTAYRAAVDRAGQQAVQVEPLVAEAAEAFRLNIVLSEAVAGFRPS